MVQSLFATSLRSQWRHLIGGISLFLCAVLLVVLGGFPPGAWQLLVHVVTTLPALWTARGVLIVFPFIGLLLQSFLFFVLWLAWVFGWVTFLRYAWKMFQQRREGESPFNEEQELPQYVPLQKKPSPGTSASAGAPLPDTASLCIPSSTRRYRIQHTVPPLHSSPTRSPLPARTRATHLVVYDEPTQPLHITETGDAIEGYTEYEAFLQESNEDQDDEKAALQQTPLRLCVGIGSHPGVKRKDRPNEDSVLGIQDTYVTEDGMVPTGLFIVADGMGGHSNGQEASRIAVCSVSEVITPLLLSAKPEDTLGEVVLQDGVKRANKAIYQQNQQHFLMGTTITSALVVGRMAYIVNVGDSRTYLYRSAEGLTQITEDHSHVWQMFRRELIDHDDIYTHPKRNEIYRCLGEDEQVEIDTFRVPLQDNDVLLLCSDGLWEMVRNPEIEQIMRDNVPDANQICRKLIEAALRNGGADNVSVVVVAATA